MEHQRFSDWYGAKSELVWLLYVQVSLDLFSVLKSINMKIFRFLYQICLTPSPLANMASLGYCYFKSPRVQVHVIPFQCTKNWGPDLPDSLDMYRWWSAQTHYFWCNWGMSLLNCVCVCVCHLRNWKANASQTLRCVNMHAYFSLGKLRLYCYLRTY